MFAGDMQANVILLDNKCSAFLHTGTDSALPDPITWGTLLPLGGFGFSGCAIDSVMLSPDISGVGVNQNTRVLR